jgi:hypothetical protein
MLALSIRQPWAWLICKGFKNIENREWPIRGKKFPFRVYIHAGLTPDKEALSQAGWLWLKQRLTAEAYRDIYGHIWRDFLTFGSIIGEVDITGCVTESKVALVRGEIRFYFSLSSGLRQPNPNAWSVRIFQSGTTKGGA